MSKVLRIGRDSDPAKRVRIAWGSAIRDARNARGWTIPFLVEQMVEVSNGEVRVTAQAVGMWERGETAPRVHHQPVVARALGIPHRLLFAITEDAA